MTATLRDALVLFRLRRTLLFRATLTRYTRSARLAAPVRVAVMGIVALWLLGVLVLPIGLVMTASLQGEEGKRALASWLGTVGSAAVFLIFFYAVLALIGTLTYRSDLRLLLMTPVSPRLILGEKILGTSLGFSALLVLALPGLIAAGDQLHLGAAFTVGAFAAILLLPVAPVSLAALLVLVVLRFIPPARARTVTAILGTGMGAVLFIGQQLLVRRHATQGAQGTHLPQLPNSLPSTWVGHTLAAIGTGRSNEAALYAIGSVLLATLLFVLAADTAGRVFQTGVLSYGEVRRRHPQARRRRDVRAGPVLPAAVRPAWWPLLWKEWILLRRDSQRIVAMFYPLVLIAFYFWQLTAYRNSTDNPGGLFYGSVYGVLIVASILLLNSVAPSIVNREGRAIYLLALAPLSSRDVLLSKWAISVLPPLLIVEGFLAVAVVVVHLSLAEALVIGVTMAVLLIALVGVSIVVNLIWPKFGSANPRKQASRIASLVSAGIEFVVGIGTFGLLSLAFGLASTNLAGAMLVYAVLIGLLAGFTIVSAWAGSRLLRRLLMGDRLGR